MYRKKAAIKQRPLHYFEPAMEHSFTPIIFKQLHDDFKNKAKTIFETSPLLQYINLKTRSASRGSKSRGSYANLYVLYTLIEDYLNGGFVKSRDYSLYEGAKFSSLLTRARKLPFGTKIQNHAFNNRLNDEFRKFFPHLDEIPVRRDLETQRYWINERLLVVTVAKQRFNLAQVILKIIDSYIAAKKNLFQQFLDSCKQIANLKTAQTTTAKEFITNLMLPSVDARIFEIVSFAILKTFYREQKIYWGYTREHINEEFLALFKTGRTNANDGGIDYVMKPLGRFFQVTETTDVKKYFLDIDKIQKYPITFVVKSNNPPAEIYQAIEENAQKWFPVCSVVQKFMNCIEEIITIPILLDRLDTILKKDQLSAVIDELVQQSAWEFHLDINE